MHSSKNCFSTVGFKRIKFIIPTNVNEELINELKTLLCWTLGGISDNLWAIDENVMWLLIHFTKVMLLWYNANLLRKKILWVKKNWRTTNTNQFMSIFPKLYHAKKKNSRVFSQPQWCSGFWQTDGYRIKTQFEMSHKCASSKICTYHNYLKFYESFTK